MTDVENLTGTEWVGFHFALLAIGRTSEGEKLLQKALPTFYTKVKDDAKLKKIELQEKISKCKDVSKDGPQNVMNESKLECMKGIIRQRHFPTHKEFISCVEQMLVFHAKVNSKKFLWSKTCFRRFDESLKLPQKQTVFCFPHVEGDCHEYPKMHLIEHLSGSILECGVHFPGNTGEK